MSYLLRQTASCGTYYIDVQVSVTVMLTVQFAKWIGFALCLYLERFDLLVCDAAGRR